MNEQETRFRIRKKGDRYQLDKLQDSRVIKSWTLNPKKLGEMFECPLENSPKVSKIDEQNEQKGSQTFAYDVLSEPAKMDTSSLKKEDVHEELNKLMGDVYELK